MEDANFESDQPRPLEMLAFAPVSVSQSTHLCITTKEGSSKQCAPAPTAGDVREKVALSLNPVGVALTIIAAPVANRSLTGLYHLQRCNAIRVLPCQEPEPPPGQQNALQSHHAGVCEEAPRQQWHQAAHGRGHGPGVGEEVRQVQRDESRHAGIEATHSHAQDEHFPEECRAKIAAKIHLR